MRFEARLEELPAGYAGVLASPNGQIRAARLKAGLLVSRELVLLYWMIGRLILERQAEDGWGLKVIERLAEDLRHEFSDMLGLSRANLFYMRAFAEACQEEQIVQQLAGQIPWWHNMVTIARLKDPNRREWYIRACIENGRRAVLPESMKGSLPNVGQLEGELMGLDTRDEDV